MKQILLTEVALEGEFRCASEGDEIQRSRRGANPLDSTEEDDAVDRCLQQAGGFEILRNISLHKRKVCTD